VKKRLSAIARRPLHRHLNSLARLWHLLKGRLYYRCFFGSFGSNTRLVSPLILHEPRFMHIGNDTLINHRVRMEAHPTPSHPVPELRIGNDVNIEQNVHIICHNRVLIGDNASISGNCSITDLVHPFDGVPQGQKANYLIQDDDNTVEIGRHAHIGFGCNILPGARIGEYAVIGAGSVVRDEIPAFSVATGSPARVIRTISRPEY